ncbi:hypothetical protein ACP70R_006303 [Stipagrostis hirtigluma subsp. patula]
MTRKKPINRKDDHVDRLSTLPDDVLLAILDKLDVRDAVRASTLARRWRRLPYKLSQLTVDCARFLPDDSSFCLIDDIPRINALVVEATESMLSRRDPSQHAIRSVAITFFLRVSDCIAVGRAVGHAMAANKVETAELTILTEMEDGQCEDDDLIDYGGRFKEFFHACPDAFCGLTHLKLQDLRFGDELDVPNVLTACTRLRRLHLSNCDSEAPTTLRVEHPNLDDLSILNCGFGKLELGRLPKLTQLAFEDWISSQNPISFDHVPLLETLTLSNTCLSWHKTVKLSEFLGRRTSVQSLILDFRCERIWVQPEAPRSLKSAFQKLRVLYLLRLPEGVDLGWSMFILEAAPALEEMYLVVWDHACAMVTDEEARREGAYSEEKGVEWEPPAAAGGGFEHRSLARLVVFGFQAEEYLVRYVRRVMEAAVNLEEVVLYGRVACEECADELPSGFRYPRSKKQRWSLRNRIAEGTGSLAAILFPDAPRTIIFNV